jgi:hypothetical protein
MPNWEDPRGPRQGGGWRETGRREGERDRPRGRREWQGGERRAFDEDRGRGPARSDERGDEPWARDRYASRFDQERTDYGRYEQDAGEAGWRRRGAAADTARYGGTSPVRGGEPYAYGGQEYGLEGHPGVSPRDLAGRDPARDTRFGERRPGFDWDDPGLGQSQAGYGAGARSHPDEEFDPDYLRWREEQMRGHDRDYQEWRRAQHRDYDDQYRRYRDERQRHFGEAFHQWRAHRSSVGGVPDTAIGTVGQGQGGYGDKTANPGGFNAASAYERPSGMLDPPGHLSADPAMSQTGGTVKPSEGGAHSASDGSSEFGKEPPQVQAAAGGQAQGHEHKPDADKRH